MACATPDHFPRMKPVMQLALKKRSAPGTVKSVVKKVNGFSKFDGFSA
jgi:hypothetical protein